MNGSALWPQGLGFGALVGKRDGGTFVPMILRFGNYLAEI
jgi:hypothetical protein